MSKIRELKSNVDTTLNLIDILELFSPEKKSKYTETLLRIMKSSNNITNHRKDIVHEMVNRFNFLEKQDLEKFSDIQILLLFRFIDSFFNTDDLKNFRKFSEFNERGLIEQNDLSKYKTFDALMNQLSLAELKLDMKGLENEIIKVFEDEEWLLVRPLTLSSSKKYGSNTKWCTTSENGEYFLRYTKRGVLIYCLNKKTGYKVASFYSLDKGEPEFSFWDQKDNRIDSLETDLPDSLRKLVQETSKNKNAKTNRFLLSDEQRMIEEKFINSFKLVKQSESIEQPSEAILPMRNRIENAINRENDVDMDTMLEEREEERLFEDVENNDPLNALDSPIDGMRWASSGSTINYESE